MDARPRGLWSPLDIAEAGTVLRDGEYGLWVERCETGRVRLTGPDVGAGIELGGHPSWADLYRALTRLGRVRGRYDPVRLGELAEWLNGGSTGSASWRVAAVEPLVAGRGPEADRCADILSTVDGWWIPADAEPGCGYPVPHAADVRLAVRGRELARRQAAGWARLSGIVAADPSLRMYCATRPAPMALGLDGATALVAQLAEPVPQHPRHPGGTVVVDLPALLHADESGVPELLRYLLGNRAERRADMLDHFLEHFVRPLVRTFRMALDSHRLGLLALDRHGVGVEVSCESQATGRIVVTDCAGVGDATEPERVSTGAGALMSTVDELVEGFGRIDPEAPVRAAVDTVLGEELRDLPAHTAHLLSGDHPLRRFVHTVPAGQDDVLKDVLNRVQERTRARRHDPELAPPAVIIDVDLCAIVPTCRTRQAARDIAGGRPGAPEGIPELADPAKLRALPSYPLSTWAHFVEVNELDQSYPEVDWRQVCEDFRAAFLHGWDEALGNTAGEVVNAGLARFVWDVRDAGGTVVFCTGRAEHLRERTARVLAAGGVPDSPLLCVPDDDTSRPVSELKVRRLREFGDLDVVAVFDDLLVNRLVLAKEHPGALAVAVEIPGLAAERMPGRPVPDRAPLIATFETAPPRPAEPGLSHAHSLEELQIRALRNDRHSEQWAVRLSDDESAAVVDSVLADADRSAQRTAHNARVKFGLDGGHPAADSATETRDAVYAALHHVFTRKQFLKGSRANYRIADLRRDAEPFVRRGEPIEVVLLGFPVKQCLNRLKAAGPLPDLAEFGAASRLRELDRAVRGIHPAGLHFNIHTDGRHFRSRPRSITGAYSDRLREYVRLAGIGGNTTIEEVDTVARERLNMPDLAEHRARRLAHYAALITDNLRGLDITDNPLRTLQAVQDRVPWMPGELLPAMRLFREMLMSVIYSVSVPVPKRANLLDWSRRVFADIYNPADTTVSNEVLRARVQVLRRTWHTVIRYLATLLVDDELGYEQMLPDRIRLTISAVQPGRCGFTYLGGSGLLPWQGTGVVDPRGRVGADFAVSLHDQGFVPVYSSLVGPRQPWFMVPADGITLRGRGRAPDLDPELAENIRLRRK